MIDFDKTVIGPKITDAERAQVMQDVANVLSDEPNRPFQLDISPREVYVMMTMLKEQQDALAATVTSI